MVDSFAAIQGNEPVKKYLSRMIQNGKTPGSLLFSGIDGIGKSMFANYFARALLQTNKMQHPDIHHYYPEGKVAMHTIESMRRFSDEVYLAPFEAKKKIFIIHDAHRMLSYSANALLKTFEEPARDAIIILISGSPEQLLPTVLSRCQTIRFLPLKREEICRYLVEHKEAAKETAEQIALLCKGSLGQALNLLSNESDPIRTLILTSLSTGIYKDYVGMKDLVDQISQHIAHELKEEEATLREKVFEGVKDSLTAQQKAGFEKEIEGVLTLRKKEYAFRMFDDILSWFRDLALVHAGANPALLYNPDYQFKLTDALQRGEWRPLEELQFFVNEALVSLERSTSLEICLENLLLKISR